MNSNQFQNMERGRNPKTEPPPEGKTVLIRTKTHIYSTAQLVNGRGFLVLTKFRNDPTTPDDIRFIGDYELIPTSEVISWQEVFTESFIYFIKQIRKETE